MIAVIRVEFCETATYKNCEKCYRATVTPYCGFCGSPCSVVPNNTYKYYTNEEKPDCLYVGIEIEEGSVYPSTILRKLEDTLTHHYRVSRGIKMPLLFTNLKPLTFDEAFQLFG